MSQDTSVSGSSVESELTFAERLQLLQLTIEAVRVASKVIENDDFVGQFLTRVERQLDRLDPQLADEPQSDRS